ncbi:unnamed protein product [Cylindrotheca closterium]|uniref:Uncharacterized protein n=1 Tax=Cylindrotheca closterium TaxID=2856 RepID=A0AAD2CCN5_9STRA|nr:unnamed protein product [Cylindrotheca closterium]
MPKRKKTTKPKKLKLNDKEWGVFFARHERTYIPVTKQMRQKEPRLIYMYWVDHFGEENPIKVYEPGETYVERKKRLEAKHDKHKKNLHERMTTAEINAGEQSTLTDCFFLPKKKKRT